ncbi:MAG: VCBS repeat-containing protein [Planctomycetota bacterium]
MRLERPSRIGATIAMAGFSAVAAGQVTVTGEYERVIRVQLQIDANDPTSPPDQPVLLIGLDQVDVLFKAQTVATLATAPTVDDVAVEVLDFRVTNLRLVFEDDPRIDLTPFGFGGDVVIAIRSDDLALDLRDDGTVDRSFEVIDGPGSALVDYDGLLARALGTFTLSGAGADPVDFDVSIFNDFVTDFPALEYELLVRDGALVQRVGLPFSFNLFGANVLGSDFSIIAAPALIDETFELESSVVFPCDEGDNPSGSFGSASQFLPVDIDARHVELADVDNDGHVDIVASVGSFGSIDELVTILNRGDGTFDDFILNPGAAVDRSSRGLTLAHFNDDGIIDAAVVGSTDDGLEVLFGNGDGTFTLSQKFENTTDFPTDVEAADLNGDGAIDIVDGSGFDDLLNLYLNDGAGTFALVESIPLADGSGNIELADFDADEDVDIAVVIGAIDTIQIFLNDGTAGFTPGATIPVVDPSSIRAGRLNSDASIDLVFTSFAQDSVTVLQNNGDATFVAGPSFPAGDGAGSLTLADVDGDNDLDVAVAANGEDSVAVLLNDGAGGLGAPTLVPGVLNTGEVEAADLDGDGDPEIVADQFSFSDPDGIRVFRNGCTAAGPTPCNTADLALPFGVTDLSDIDAFIAAFLLSDPLADLVEPIGVVDLSDIDAFIADFLAGCP